MIIHPASPPAPRTVVRAAGDAGPEGQASRARTRTIIRHSASRRSQITTTATAVSKFLAETNTLAQVSEAIDSLEEVTSLARQALSSKNHDIALRALTSAAGSADLAKRALLLQEDATLLAAGFTPPDRC